MFSQLRAAHPMRKEMAATLKLMVIISVKPRVEGFLAYHGHKIGEAEDDQRGVEEADAERHQRAGEDDVGQKQEATVIR